MPKLALINSVSTWTSYATVWHSILRNIILDISNYFCNMFFIFAFRVRALHNFSHKEKHCFNNNAGHSSGQLDWAEFWTTWPPEVPSNLSHAVILWMLLTQTKDSDLPFQMLTASFSPTIPHYLRLSAQ